MDSNVKPLAYSSISCIASQSTDRRAVTVSGSHGGHHLQQNCFSNSKASINLNAHLFDSIWLLWGLSGEWDGDLLKLEGASWPVLCSCLWLSAQPLQFHEIELDRNAHLAFHAYDCTLACHFPPAGAILPKHCRLFFHSSAVMDSYLTNGYLVAQTCVIWGRAMPVCNESPQGMDSSSKVDGQRTSQGIRRLIMDST